MTAKFTILLALLCGLLSLCSVLAGTSAEGKTSLLFLSYYILHYIIDENYNVYPQNPKFEISCKPKSYLLHFASKHTYYTIGLAYLEAKGKEDGVVTLPSGLLYKEIRPGNGEFLIFSMAVLSIPSDSHTHV